MKKLLDLCDSILAKHGKAIPRIELRVKNHFSNEQYSCSYAGGVVQLDAESSLAAVFGLSTLIMGIKSGHLSECLGENKPRFPLRLLWFKGEFPQKNLLADTDRFCGRLLEIGYNTILFGLGDLSYEHVEDFCIACAEYGIKVFVKPQWSFKQRCPIDAAYVADIQSKLSKLVKTAPTLHGIFWEGGLFHPDDYHHPKARDATHFEMIHAEASMVEAVLGTKKLIYSVVISDPNVANQQAEWLSELCDSVGTHTSIAFSAVAGDPCEDHLEPHPFWATLRKSIDVSGTPLMPIVNIGSVGQGEGLWPSLSLDLSDRYLSQCVRHHFGGIIGVVNSLPVRGALLECSLWVASQMQWKKTSAGLLAETWFKAQRPELNFEKMVDPVMQLRDIAIELSFLRSFQKEQPRDRMTTDESRALSESLLVRLAKLQILFEKEEKNRTFASDKPSWNDYFQIFALDARRLISQFMQTFHISGLDRSEDKGEGFWVGPKANFLDQPSRGIKGSRKELIHSERINFI